MVAEPERANGLPHRWSVKAKRVGVLGLRRGDLLEAVSLETQVPAQGPEPWRRCLRDRGGALLRLGEAGVRRDPKRARQSQPATARMTCPESTRHACPRKSDGVRASLGSVGCVRQ